MLAGDDDAKRGAIDAWDLAQAKRAAGHERAGIATADNGIGFIVFKLGDGLHHRGIFLALNRLNRLFIHPDDLSTVNDFDPILIRVEFANFQQPLDQPFIADQHEVTFKLQLFDGIKKPTNKLSGPFVSPHGVDCNGAVDCALAHRWL